MKLLFHLVNGILGNRFSCIYFPREIWWYGKKPYIREFLKVHSQKNNNAVLLTSSSLYFFLWSEVFRVCFKERCINSRERIHIHTHTHREGFYLKFFQGDVTFFFNVFQDKALCKWKHLKFVLFQSLLCGSFGSRLREHFAEENGIWLFHLGALRKSLHLPPTSPFFKSSFWVIIAVSCWRLFICIHGLPWNASFTYVLGT